MATRTRASGLPIPRVEDATLQRWLEQASQTLRRLDGQVIDVMGRPSGGGTGGSTIIVPGGPANLAVDACSVPPVPEGFEVFAGLGIVLLFWDNPFRYCSNHATTRVYRGTTDVFADATLLGSSTDIAYIDSAVEPGTTYYYWIRWVSTTSIEGIPTSPAVEATPAVDPVDALNALDQALRNDALVQDLADFSDPFRALDRVASYRSTLAALLSSAFASNLLGRVGTAESAITDAATARTALTNAIETVRMAAAAAQTTADGAVTSATTARDTADAARTAATQAAADSLVATNTANDARQAALSAAQNARNIARDIGTLAREDVLTVYAPGGSAAVRRFAAATVAGGTLNIGTDAADTTGDVAVSVLTQSRDMNGAGRLFTLGLSVGIDWSQALWLRVSANRNQDLALTQANRQSVVGDVDVNREWHVEEDVPQDTIQSQITEVESNVAGKADASALDALTTRVSTAEGGVTANTRQITALEARLVGTSLGPETNSFTGDTRAAAEAARDTYAAANPDWLAMYNADDDINIRLTWGVLRVFQRRVNTAAQGQTPVYVWQDNGEVEPTAAAISTLSATVTQQGRDISTNAEDITALEASVAGKADASALMTLAARVTTNEGAITTAQSAITTLSGRVDGKADTSALSALTSRVTTAEGTIGTHTTQITALEARLVGTSLGPAQNEFTGADRAAAEAARDAYAADPANAAWLGMYQADDTLNIRLTFGVLQQYQRLVNTAAQGGAASYEWQDNGEAEATATALSTLNATVEQQGRSITTNANDITDLGTRVDGKADTTALTALSTRVTTAEDSITTIQSDLTSLESDLDGKADASALTELSSRVDANAGGIEVNQGNVARLSASLDGLALGPAQNTFEAETLTAATAARDAYTSNTDNADWLAMYDADADLHIRLIYGTTTVYQYRSGGAWTNATADPRAAVSAVEALTTRLSTAEGGVTANTQQITSLEARLAGTNLGPAQNEFTGMTRAAAEAARDAYAADAANSAWLMAYQADDDLNIRLTWGVLRVFQRLISDGASPPTYTWTDNGEVEPTAAAVATLNATVMQQGTRITTNADAITALTTTVAGKADASALDALTARVTTAESAITTEQSRITALTSTVAGKADTTALTALTNRVAANEDGVSVNQENVALLQAVLDGLMLGPAENTFMGEDRAAAETVRDTYFTANPAMLAKYDADADFHIRLQFGDTTVYQNRASNAWVDVTADPRASSAALSSLSTRVAANEQGVAANAQALTQLSATLGQQTRGPAPNEFIGDTLDEAEDGLDAQSADDMNWLGQYDANENLYVVLRYLQ